MRFYKPLLAAIGITAFGAELEAQAPKVPCASPTINTAQITLGNLRSILSSDEDSDSLYRAVGHLPKVPIDSVALVSADSVCDAVARTMALRIGPSAPVEPVWVIAVGQSRYFVIYAPSIVPRRLMYAVLDNRFTWLANVR